jgi:hypothetical protein
MLDEVVDSGDQVSDASEATSTDRLLGDESEPTLHLIEPGRVGGSVVDLEAGTFCNPESHLGMLMSGVVVDN